MIDFDQMPPDWKFAQNHAKALKPGKIQNLQQTNSKRQHCKCCFKPIEKQQISICSNSKQLQSLGFGFPLYFIFQKYSIILVLILICSYSAVSLYWGIEQNYTFCSHRRLGGSPSPTPSHDEIVSGNEHCTSFLIMFSRIQNTVAGQEIILRIASFIIHILALIYIRDSLRKIIQYYDEKTTSLSDYSFIMKKLPLKNGIQKGIKNIIQNNPYFVEKWRQLQNKFSDEHFKSESKIKKITLLPDITHYFNLKQQKNKLIEEKRKNIIQWQKDMGNKISQQGNKINRSGLDLKKERIDLEDKLKDKKDEMKKQRENICQLAEDDKLHAEIAIVTLNAQIYKNEVIEFGDQNEVSYEMLGEQFKELEGNIQIQQAPEPNQIIWENIIYSAKDRFIGKIIGWTLSVIFVAIATIGFYWILIAKTNRLLDSIQESSSAQNLHGNSHYAVSVFLVFLLLFLIVLFNKFVFGWVLHYFTHLEKHEHTSDEQFSFGLKYTLGMFFTTAIMTLAVEAITYHNFFSHQYGVVEQQSIMFFINAFFVTLVWFINPWQIFNLIVRKFKKDKSYYTQRQANKIMSDTPYVMGKRYAEIIQTLWFTFLYATLIPLGSFITLVGFCIYYWVDKLNLLKRSSLSHNISGQLVIVSLKLLDVTLILRPIGELVFDSQIRDHTQTCSIVFTCVALVYLIIPIDSLLEYFHEEKFKQESKTYQQVETTFLETYQSLHPIFGEEKAEHIFKKMQSRLKSRVSLTDMVLPSILELYIKPKKQGLDISSTSLFGGTNNTFMFNKKQDRQISLQDNLQEDVIINQSTKLSLQKPKKLMPINIDQNNSN